MSAVSPGALTIFSERYLPMPSWSCHDRRARRADFGTLLVNLIVLLGSARSLGEVLADLLLVHVEGARELDVVTW